MYSFFRRTRWVYITSDRIHFQLTNTQKRLFKNSSWQCNNCSISNLHKNSLTSPKQCYLSKCTYYDNGIGTQDNFEEFEKLEYMTELLALDEIVPLQNALCTENNDPIINTLNECSSILEVLNIINDVESLRSHHFPKIVIKLWNLQKIFYNGQYYINKTLPSRTLKSEYNLQVTQHPNFLKLLQCIETHCKDFDGEVLSCVFLYLNKIGVELKHPVMQLLVMRLKDCLNSDMSLTALSRFVIALFSDVNLGTYFMIQDAVPILDKALDECNTIEDLKLITICMSHMQLMLNDNLLEKYRNKVIEIKNQGKFSSNDYKTIIKVITFLSEPHWNNANAVLMSDIMLLLKNHLHLLNVLDFFAFYEVFYRNQEPGELLIEIQRCGSRLLLNAREVPDFPTEVKTKLLTSVVCFSSPIQRQLFEKTMLHSIEEPLSKHSISEMLKILTFIKPIASVSQNFWNNVMESIASWEINQDIEFMLGLCHKYINYNNDVQFRHKEFESHMLSWLRMQLQHGIIAVIPSNISLISTFVLTYGNDALIDLITRKISNNWDQLNHVDCLYISKGVHNSRQRTKNPFVSSSHLKLINESLDKAVTENLMSKRDIVQLNFLIKSCVYRKVQNKQLFYNLSEILKYDSNLSSNLIRNLIYTLKATNTLIPDFMELVSEYVINYKQHLLGFNAEKIAHFCYFLGYVPERSDELFQAITDIIIRDQERITGLSYLQTALALCFYHKLPDSFIKGIFNVSFLEKLDVELAQCYSKNVYPLRVKKCMMQLNRAVCLDYPQANVPWFHQKHTDDIQINDKSHSTVTDLSSIKSYLLRLTEDGSYLSENVLAPYGYQIDYLLHLDKHGNLIKEKDYQEGTKIALLLLKPNAFTNINVQLKGSFQLKKRHLEILGYKVGLINLKEWNSLVYGEEKLSLLSNIIWPARKIFSTDNKQTLKV